VAKAGLISIRQQTFPKGKGFRPLRTKVVVYPAPRKEVSEGGVLLPQDVQRPEIYGQLMWIGPEVPAEWPAREGDVVVFPQYAGTEIVLKDKEGEDVRFLVMDYEQLIGVLD